MDISALRSLADSFENAQPKGPSLTSTEEQLLIDEFNLFQKQCDHDLNALTVWKAKCQDTDINASAVLKEFAMAQEANLQGGAEVWIKKYVNIQVWEDDNCNKVLNHLMNYREELAQKTNSAPHEVRLVCSLNWCSLSTHSKVAAKCEVDLLGWVLSESQHNVGLVHMPVHSNHKNRLVLTESNALTKLTKCNFNLDYQYNIMFKTRLDARDNRPLMYPGRLVFPGTLLDVRTSPWFMSKLRADGRTEAVEQVASKDLLTMEDLNPDALPSTDEERYVGGARKYEQLGPCAAEALFSSLLDGPHSNEMMEKSIMFIIGSVQVGDDLKAIANLGVGRKYPLHCYAVAETECEREWVLYNITDTIKELIKAGKIVVNGMAPILDKPPDSSVSTYTLPPQYKVLVAPSKVSKGPGGCEAGEVLPKDVQLQLPIHVFKKWGSMSMYKAQFAKYMEDRELTVVEEAPETEPKTPNKRPAPNAGENGGSAKKT